MKSFYAAYLSRVFERPKRAGIVLLFFVAMFASVASDIKLRSDLQRLLPEDAPSVRGLSQLETEYADQLGRLTIVLYGERATREAEATALTEELATIDGVDRVVSNPLFDLQPFRLLFVAVPELRRLQIQIKKRVRWEKQRANPLFVSLSGNDTPPEVEQQDAPNVDRFVGNERMTFLFVHPSFPASDLDRTKRLVAEVESKMNNVSVPYAFTGRYAKRILQQELITRDITLASSIALILLILFLGFYFRSGRYVALSIAPLIIGTLFAGAVVVWTFGSLNIITGFLAAVIMGLGVDYGIHFSSALKHGEGDAKTRWSNVLSTTGRANVYAGLTTAIAFGFLAISSFRAFFEFGIIAFVGLVSVITSYFLVIPVLLALFGLPTSGDRATGAFRFSTTTLRAAFGALAITLAVIVIGISGIHFDRSFKYLQITDTDAHRLDDEVNRVLGVSQTPAVLLAENLEHEEALLEELERRRESEATIGELVHIGRFVPKDLDERRAVIREILAVVDEVPKNRKLPEHLQSMVEEAKEVVDRELTAKTLPSSIRTPLSRRTNGSVILIMPKGDLGEAVASERFARAIRDLPGAVSGDTISALSEVQLLTEIMDLVREDILKVLALNLFAISMMALVALRFRHWVRFIVNTAVSLSAVLSLLSLFDLPLNFMNALVLPVCVGLAVDASFHMFAQIEHQAESNTDDSAHKKTIAALIASFTTSMIGFGAMAVSIHPGLRSLGLSAMIAMVAIAIVNVALYRIWIRFERK